MVNYTCYRCKYITTHKSKIVNHINRKHVCKPIFKNIDLNDCKKFILKGYSYQQYYESIKSHENSIQNLCKIDARKRHAKKVWKMMPKCIQERPAAQPPRPLSGAKAQRS